MNRALCSGGLPADGPLSPGNDGDPSLGSGPSVCKADDPDLGFSCEWTSLQSYSFQKWCASLPRTVLSSRTAFSVFLLQSFRITRSDIQAPAKLLFSLSVLKCGIFETLPAHCSSRRRRRVDFGQAFHVLIMALNFLHEDFHFVDCAKMAYVPNEAQKAALSNMRGLLKAFGSRAGETQVPAGGRRSTAFVAMLSDLSDFFTAKGLSDDAYYIGFDGAGGLPPGEVQADTTRAEELLPYRSLDPSRLKLTGRAQWDPSIYLDGSLWLPFVEPQVLLWISQFDDKDLPNLDREDPQKVLELAKIWEINGLLRLSTTPVGSEMKPSCLRVFNCYKGALQDIQIGDKRGRNQIEAYLPGSSRSLPSGRHLTVLEADPFSEEVVIYMSDRKGFYHQLKVTQSKAETTVLWPPFKTNDLIGTKAYQNLIARLEEGKKRKPREAVGDYLGDRPLPLLGSKVPEQVYACFNSVVQGDHLGVEIVTQGHSNLLKRNGLLCESEEISSTRPFRGARCLQGLIIDDFFSVSIDPACLVGGWTSCLMYRRPLISVLDKVHRFADISLVDQSRPRILDLPRLVALELVLLSIMAPLISSDLSSRLLPEVSATDSSDHKGAIVVTEADPSLARSLYRTGKKKGGYCRILSREKALFSQITLDWEPEEEWAKASPSKPIAMRYHFVEVCGEAGKIAKFAAEEGMTVGPVVDIDRSPAFDLSLLRISAWICFMLEQGRLDSFFLAPPCATFSAAAHPCLRSYACPRGFNQKERRTLFGTTSALRSLDSMFVAARAQAVGLWETPRRSNMAWLKEWIYFFDMLLANETWLATCNFGSPHQKEFRILGCNIEMDRLNFPCTRDHSHIPIAGALTKPSATYTDDLARFFASEIARAVWIKTSARKAADYSVKGLESIVSNDVAESFHWRNMTDPRWKKNSHINIKEAAAFGRLAYHLAVCSPKSRFSVGLDSHVAISAIVKGRSPSYGLRPAVRRIGATLSVRCLYPSLHFLPTRLNKADHPTRDSSIPSSAPHSIVKGLNFLAVLDLDAISNLKRFAVNWGRLTLLLLGSRPPWLDSGRSWRFAHYPYEAYLFKWRSKVARKVRHDDLDFDASLGYPGEGPPCPRLSLRNALAWFLFVATLLVPRWTCGLVTRSVMPVDVLVVFVCLSRCHCFYFVGSCWFLVASDLSPLVVDAAPTVSRHGSLQPRDRGDQRRQGLRSGIVLEEGRPVLAQTKAAREKLLVAFDDWLKSQGTDLETLLDPKGLDIESINILLERYGRAMYHAGRPYGHYSEVVNAIGARRPSLKRMLQGAWNLAFTWLREEPPVHHVALPWQVLTAILVVAFTWGWNRVAGVVALSWGGLTRIGEVLKAYRSHLVLPKDLGYTIQYALLQIEEPKTRFRSARHQVARLDHPQLLQVLQLSFQDLKQHERLWSFSPQTLRNRFQRLLAALRLDQLPAGLSKGLDLGSLRAGGASWMMLVTEDSEMVRRRGRWLSSKIMEIYVQEVSAIQFLHQIPDPTRRLVLSGTDLFPRILQQLMQWHASGTPESAWKYLLI